MFNLFLYTTYIADDNSIVSKKSGYYQELINCLNRLEKKFVFQSRAASFKTKGGAM